MDYLTKNNNDLALAAACARGDQRAQRFLFERVKNVMFGVCLRFSENRTAAEDLLQDGFIRVFRDIGKYRGDGPLEGWIRKVFVRTAIEAYHQRKKLPLTIELDQLENTLFEPENIHAEDPEAVIALLQQLPPGFRAVLNLAILEDKSHEEIARELGITASTSRSQLTRAKAFLKKAIRKTLVFI